MKKKKWSTVKGQGGNGGIFVMGEKPEQLPDKTFISLTRGEGLNFLQLIVNQLLTIMVMGQMKKAPGLIYAEISGELKKGQRVWPNDDGLGWKDNAKISKWG